MVGERREVGMRSIWGGCRGPGGRSRAGRTLGRVYEGIHGDIALPATDLLFVHVRRVVTLPGAWQTSDASGRHPAAGGREETAERVVVVCSLRCAVDGVRRIFSHNPLTFLEAD